MKTITENFELYQKYKKIAKETETHFITNNQNHKMQWIDAVAKKRKYKKAFVKQLKQQFKEERINQIKVNL